MARRARNALRHLIHRTQPTTLQVPVEHPEPSAVLDQSLPKPDQSLAHEIPPSHSTLHAQGSLPELSGNSKALLNLMMFFDPAGVDMDILTRNGLSTGLPQLSFLPDKAAFDEAVSELTSASLVSSSDEEGFLSLKKVGGVNLLSQIKPSEQVMFLDAAVNILWEASSQSGESTLRRGQDEKSWTAIGNVLLHTIHLSALTQKLDTRSKNMERMATLVVRGGTYFWETEDPTIAHLLIQFALSLTSIKRKSELRDTAVNMLGHTALDCARPKGALALYNESYLLRKEEKGQIHLAVAEALDSIASCHIELGSVSDPHHALDKAVIIRMANDSTHMSRTMFIRALAYLRAGTVNTALESLQHCWRLQGLTKGDIEGSSSFDHRSDMVLLSEICMQQGNVGEALSLLERSIKLRPEWLPLPSPRVADAQFRIAQALMKEGKKDAAATRLKEIVQEGGGEVELRGHVARACWHLASMEEAAGKEEEAKKLRNQARNLKATIGNNEVPDGDSDEAFDRLVSWFLLR